MIKELTQRMKELHDELKSPYRFRSRKEIIDEAKNVKIKILQLRLQLPS